MKRGGVVTRYPRITCVRYPLMRGSRLSLIITVLQDKRAASFGTESIGIETPLCTDATYDRGTTAFAHTHYRLTIPLVPCAHRRMRPKQCARVHRHVQTEEGKKLPRNKDKIRREKRSKSIVGRNTAEAGWPRERPRKSCSTLLVRQIDEKEK